ncbi:MAG: selenocysteine-specific translation elongation factor [Steroidobacteraceae bacterium]|nr:selenocysteine-specific translation elongation factor [Steroidobacteraceae bacterium]
MIVGTAGHIDHGKTTLVKALTGVDTDRLPEEKQRGISIELGYAFLDTPDGARIAFVDVPGHERLIHTMLAGATGFDFALLLVAADDGPMPQTREHLAVLSLLEIGRGAVVITKADRVEPARVDEVRAQAAAMLAGTSLEGAPVVAVSALRGDGLDDLRTLLVYAARDIRREEDAQAAFRLAIDRAFTLPGVGTVVTGTVHAGSVAVGDELVLLPGERRVRVRSLHAQNAPVDRAQAGQRCAVALAGVAKDRVQRGDWLVATAAVLSTERLDTTLRVWTGELHALRSGTRVHVHVGAASVLGSVALLDAEVLAPGAEGRAQIVLHGAIGAWHGDRLVLRDAAASRTIAGGRVLDPFAPARYRRTAQRLAELDALALPDADARLAGLLAVAPLGVDLRRQAAREGRAIGAMPPHTLRQSDPQGGWALGAAHAEAACAQMLAMLAVFHERTPEELGPDAARLRRLTLPRLSEPLWHGLLALLQTEGRLAARGAFVYLPEHGVRLSATEERIVQKVLQLLARDTFDGTWVRNVARDTNEPESLVRTTLARLARRGELHQVVKDLYYPIAAMERLAGIVRKVAASRDGVVSAALFRDATGIGRKRAIQILEHFDSIGLLRRIGDLHQLRIDTQVFAEMDQSTEQTGGVGGEVQLRST